MQICCGCLSIAQHGQRLLLCGRCLTAEYCTKQCQRAHWRHHRAGCADMALQKLLVTVHDWTPSDGLKDVQNALLDAASELEFSDAVPLSMARAHVERMWALVKVVYEGGVGKGTLGDGEMSMAPALYVATLNLVGQCISKKRLGMEDRHEAFVDEVYKAICGEGSRIDLSHTSAICLAKLCGDLLESISRIDDAVELGRRVRGAWLQLEKEGEGGPPERLVFAFLQSKTSWYDSNEVEKLKLRAAKPYEYWKCPSDKCHCQGFRGIFEDWRHMHKRLLDLALSCDCLCVHNLIFAARCGLDSDSLLKGLEVARRALRVIEEGADRCIQNRECWMLQGTSMVAKYLRRLRRDSEAEAIIDGILQLPERQHILEQDPQEAAQMLITKARILCHRKDFSEALSFALQARDLNDEHYSKVISRLLADIYDALGQPDRALDMYVACECGKCAGVLASHHRRSAKALWVSGDHEGAMAVLKEYAERVREWLSNKCYSPLGDTYEVEVASEPLRYLMWMLKEIGGREEEVVEVQCLMTAWTQRDEEVRATVLQETREQMAQRVKDYRHPPSKQIRSKARSKGRKGGKVGGRKGRGSVSLSVAQQQIQTNSPSEGSTALAMHAEADTTGEHDAAFEKDEDVADAVIDEEQDECAVCLGELGDDDPEVAVCACAHRFHSCCLDAWVVNCQRKALAITCPTCRRALSR